MEDLSARLDEALAVLADGCRTTSDVARRLEQAGCKGPRRAACACPVAIWLGRRLGLDSSHAVSVGFDLASIDLDIDGSCTAEAPVPAVIALFVGMFDHDSFPALVAS